MKFLFFTIILLIGIILLNSCSKSPNNGLTKSQTGTINHHDTLTFHLSEEMSPSWTIAQYLQLDNKEYVAVIDNINDFKIFIFEIKDGDANLVKTIRTEKNGPNGIGRLKGFYFANWDSIFTIDSYSYRLHLIDSAAKVKKRYNLLEGEVGLDSYLPNVGFYWKIYKIDDQLIIPATSDVGAYKSEYKANNFMIIYDLSKEKFSYHGTDYPEKYKDGYYGIEYAYPSFVINGKDQVIYNWAFVNHLIVKDNNEKKLTLVDVNSKYIDDNIPPLGPYTINFYEITSYKIKQDKYLGLIHDRNNQLYYRAFEQKFWEEDVSKILNRTANGHNLKGGRTGYLIMDEDFNLLNDYLLPHGLSSKAILTTKKGVYSKDFIYNEKEDEVRYISVFVDR